MILKIWNELENGWIYLGGVKKVEQNNNYCPHIEKDSHDIEFVLKMRDAADEKLVRKNTSSISAVDRCLVDPEWIYDTNTDSIIGDLLTKRSSKYQGDIVYGCEIVEITFQDNTVEIYGINHVNKVYLLNDEGKTVERI